MLPNYTKRDETHPCYQCTERYRACQDTCPKLEKRHQEDNLKKQARTTYFRTQRDVWGHYNAAYKRRAHGR